MWHPPRSVRARPATGTSGPRAGVPAAPVVTARESAPVRPAEHSATVSPKGAGTGSATFLLDGTPHVPGAGARHSHRTPPAPAGSLPSPSRGGRRDRDRSGPRTSRTADPASP
ncbi:hypothetical protein SAMN05216505_102485 [Streptomyces prasinopilosus]|uniref:Uncharacterized protein n=1 Tax=Streptomyces prasinopilosus TaxID=67344 RepID=A0A1G6MDB0_9ACTN|nr:hypothetical protein SAMN05216505_102485 [Streptomyces prasinopilosus]